MKKNRMMRIASCLLVLVLLTTCVISGTFAKYVSSGTANDKATVAKWGVEITVTGNDAFGTKYDDAVNASGTKVVSNRLVDGNLINVLAPGTNGNLGSIKITGQPEVMVAVAVSLDLELDGWTVGGDFYCPIVFSDGTTTINGIEYDNADELEADVEDLVNKSNAAISANTNLNDTYDVAITWSWAFETGADDSAKAANNIKDTALGNAAAATITATWNASAVQVD